MEAVRNPVLNPTSASGDFGPSPPGECGDTYAFGHSSLGFFGPRNQITCASALASLQIGNWMPVVSLLDECPAYQITVDPSFPLLSLSPLFLHPCEQCGGD